MTRDELVLRDEAFHGLAKLADKCSERAAESRTLTPLEVYQDIMKAIDLLNKL